MNEDNSAEMIAEGLQLVGQGLSVIIKDIAIKLAEFLDPICKAIMQLQNNNKQRLPRKIKKKYKKLGIYDEWKEDNL